MTGELLYKTGSVICEKIYSGSLLVNENCIDNTKTILNIDELEKILINYILLVLFVYMTWKLLMFYKILIFKK